jgi:PTH1 family peptidyl-tRNA hydrolase
MADAHGLAFRRRLRTKARVAEGQMGEQPVVLAKPHTFMNLSGKAVKRLCQVYDVPAERVLVVYDDLDLPLGRLRMRPEGGSGGHKGMRSIIDLLGTQAFPRLRVGVDRPPGRMDPAIYVLQPFDEEEESLAAHVVQRAVEAVECWLTEGIMVAMDRFNRPAQEPEAAGQEAQT